MGTVVLLMTDVVGSTRLWSSEPQAMDAAMRRHHELVHGLVAEHGGWRPLDQGEGDSVFAALRSPTAAVACAAAMQRALAAENWPTSVPLTVRTAVHLGEVVERDGNLYGEAVNRCARLRALGSGGQTLLSAAVFELVRDALPTGTSVTDLGEHRMKDLTRPERVHQLDIAELNRSFPPLSSLDRATHNLPVQSAPFIGREPELESLLETVRGHRLVTLTGFGGMGKTRLALQAAAALSDDPDVGDVWFVDLATVTDAALVPARVAEAASVRFGADDPARALVASLAERPTLLVLDNLEQVLGCAAFVADLVAAAPTVRVLATSREPLRVRAERQFPLAPMSLPDPRATSPASVDSLSTCEAVRFFVDRACAVRPGFTITSETALTVAAICARLEGHPLALELAAARLKMLTVDTLLVRLDSALASLTGGSRDMPERHQTLRSTIAWSFDALESDEQLLLARMSALPAAADFDMVEAVCGEGLDVCDVLEVLVERSLVRTVEVDRDNRYGLLVSVREFAAEHLDANGTRDVWDRHAAHVVAVFSRRRPPYAILGLVARELAHLRAALSHLEDVRAFARFVALVVAMEDGLLHAGHLAECVRLAERAFALSEDAWQRAQLQTLRGMALATLGDVNASRDAYRLGLADARQCGDPEVHANVVVIALGSADTRMELEMLVSEYRRVREHLPPSLAQEFDAEEGNILARLLRYVDPTAAEAASRRAHESVRCVRLARVLLDTGRVSEGYEVLAQVEDPAIFGGMRSWELRGLSERARAELLRGDIARARLLASQASDGELAIGASLHESAEVLAHVERRDGQLDAAIAVLDRALAGSSHPPDPPSAALLWRRAVAQYGAGRTDAALRDVTAAREVLSEQELYLLELLGCLVAEALVIKATDAGRSARLLGSVQAHRGAWILPFDLDDDAAQLAAHLETAYAGQIERGRHLEPAVAGRG